MTLIRQDWWLVLEYSGERVPSCWRYRPDWADVMPRAYLNQSLNFHGKGVARQRQNLATKGTHWGGTRRVHCLSW